MSYSQHETIAALASAIGPAARGIIRVSGPETVRIVGQLLGGDAPAFDPLQARRYAVVIPLADGGEAEGGREHGEKEQSDRKAGTHSFAVTLPPCLPRSPFLPLPADLFLWPTRRSFTGEPLAELHLIGAPPLLNEVLEMLYLLGARPAERGEFTLRAFLAGRIDLVQAEAVLGVIEAASHQELETALGQLAGGISRRISDIREQLLLHLADLEAGLDFVEEDIEFVQREELVRRLESAASFLHELLAQSRDRMQSTGRARVVLAGLPNAGKSTLFNRLIGTESALVSTVAGTTRDYLAAVMRGGNHSWELIDTAGWETPRDGIESAAGRLREEQYRSADVIVWCTAADLNADASARNAELLAECRSVSPHVIEIRTKADLSPLNASPSVDSCQPLEVSAAFSRGMEALVRAIVDRLGAEAAPSEIVGSTAARCAESLQLALTGVLRARELCDLSAGDELMALELRDILDHLGRIVGEVHTDDILDRIFTRFCIGK